MNDEELRQVHAAIESLKLPTNKRASIEQMVADGKVEWTAPNEWRLTEKGLRWLVRIVRNASNDSRRSYGERTQDASSETRHRLSRQRRHFGLQTFQSNRVRVCACLLFTEW